MSCPELIRIGERLGVAHRVLLTTHPSPDGDGIGSMAALGAALLAQQKDVVLFCPDPIPERYYFLPAVASAVTALPHNPFDVTVLVDCSDTRMFGGEVPEGAYLGQVMALDHHKTAGDFAEILYRDPSAASAGVVVHRLLQEMGWPVELGIAEAIFCTIISDTGSFRYQNTNPEALRIAADLVEQGVDPWRVASSLYETRPRCQLDLLARVLQTLEISPDRFAAALTVSEQMMVDTGCTTEHTDGLINYARGLEGVEVAILLRSVGDVIRVSMRSRGAVDVSRIALAEGGGGHHNAAGFTAGGSVADLRSRLFSIIHTACVESGMVPNGA